MSPLPSLAAARLDSPSQAPAHGNSPARKSGDGFAGFLAADHQTDQTPGQSAKNAAAMAQPVQMPGKTGKTHGKVHGKALAQPGQNNGQSNSQNNQVTQVQATQVQAPEVQTPEVQTPEQDATNDAVRLDNKPADDTITAEAADEAIKTIPDPAIPDTATDKVADADKDKAKDKDSDGGNAPVAVAASQPAPIPQQGAALHMPVPAPAPVTVSIPAPANEQPPGKDGTATAVQTVITAGATVATVLPASARTGQPDTAAKPVRAEKTATAEKPAAGEKTGTAEKPETPATPDNQPGDMVIADGGAKDAKIIKDAKTDASAQAAPQAAPQAASQQPQNSQAANQQPVQPVVANLGDGTMMAASTHGHGLVSAVAAGTATGTAPGAAQSAAQGFVPQHLLASQNGMAPNPDVLGVAIAARSLSGARQFDIRLDPPELGHVEVRLSIDRDGKAHAHLSADQQNTLDLLQKDSSSLTRALRDAGLNVAQDGLNFSLRQQGNQQANQQGSQNGQSHAQGSPARRLSASAAIAASGITLPTALRQAAADGRLDIRV